MQIRYEYTCTSEGYHSELGVSWEYPLTLLNSERPKLYAILAFPSAIGLRYRYTSIFLCQFQLTCTKVQAAIVINDVGVGVTLKFYDKVLFYVIVKALAGKLSCGQTILVVKGINFQDSLFASLDKIALPRWGILKKF